jgi:hypothetical protein
MLELPKSLPELIALKMTTASFTEKLEKYPQFNAASSRNPKRH